MGKLQKSKRKKSKKSNRYAQSHQNGNCSAPQEIFTPGGPDVMMCTPYVYAVNADEHDIRCHHCLTMLPSGKAYKLLCELCKFSYYCSTDCKLKDDADHKTVCEAWRRMSEVQHRPSTFVLLLMKTVIQCRSGSSAVTSHSRKFGDLISHVDEIENDHELMATVVETRGMIMSWLHLADHAFPTLLEFTEIFGRVQCNTLQIITGNTGRPVAGAGVYLEASVLNHSCSPNACTVFEGPLLTVRALRKFDNLADARISYIDVLMPRKERQKMLRKLYFFTCKCKWCSSTEMDAEMFAVRCGGRDCTEPLPLDLRAQYKCSRCGFTPYDTKRSDAARDLVANSLRMFINYREKERESRITGKRFLIEKELEPLFAKMERYLHPTNPVFAVVCYFMGQARYMKKDFAQAVLWMEYTLDCYKKWLGEYDPRLALIRLNLTEALYLALKAGSGPNESFMKFACDTESMIRIIYGSDHSLSKTALKLLVSGFQKGKKLVDEDTADDSGKCYGRDCEEANDNYEDESDESEYACYFSG